MKGQKRLATNAKVVRWHLFTPDELRTLAAHLDTVVDEEAADLYEQVKAAQKRM